MLARSILTAVLACGFLKFPWTFDAPKIDTMFCLHPRTIPLPSAESKCHGMTRPTSLSTGSFVLASVMWQLCSVSLSNNNVYACLVCGKYFQGRGRNTHAYTHSVQHAHHVFINLRTCRVYCLPDSYEVGHGQDGRVLHAPLERSGCCLVCPMRE